MNVKLTKEAFCQKIWQDYLKSKIMEESNAFMKYFIKYEINHFDSPTIFKKKGLLKNL